MIREERLLKVILAPHISEKSTIAAEENNTIVFKVASDATKAEIKAAAARFLVTVGSTFSDVGDRSLFSNRTRARNIPSFVGVRAWTGSCRP